MIRASHRTPPTEEEDCDNTPAAKPIVTIAGKAVSAVVAAAVSLSSATHAAQAQVMTSSDYAHQRSPTEIAQVAAGTAELEKEQARKAMARAKEAYKAETKVKTSQTTAKKPVATKTTTTPPKAKDARAEAPKRAAEAQRKAAARALEAKNKNAAKAAAEAKRVAEANVKAARRMWQREMRLPRRVQRPREEKQ